MEPRGTPVGGLARKLRGLRSRLILSYVLLFALVLVSVGFIFHRALTVVLHQYAERILASQWGAIRGYLRFTESGGLIWAYDPEDPEEEFEVERLRRVLLITAEDGTVVEMSTGYAAIGAEPKDSIREVLDSRQPKTELRSTGAGGLYLVRMGPYLDRGKRFFLAIGYPVGDIFRLPAGLIKVYFLMLPVMLAAIAVLGWFAAGQSLRPLQEVSQAATIAAGGNLSLRLRPRGTGDELDRLIHTFNGMMQRLERNFAQMRQFTLDASHELRTPITAIRGQLEVALLTAETTGEYRAAIETAMQDVERMGQMVKSLLLLAQSESGQVHLQKTPCDLSPLLNELLGPCRLAAAEKRLALESTLTESCPAEVDRAQFERMVYHLLSNALKFTPAGGKITVALERLGPDVRLTVSDSGPGIPASHLPHLFERFYRVRDRESDEGAGLGLAFVDWIAKAHGGRVAVESETGKGTAFRVILPAGTAESSVREAPGAPVQAAQQPDLDFHA